VNMCIMLTSTAGGNVASAICNAVIANMAGIFVTPALLLYFFGTTIKLPFVDMVLKLCKKVLLPVGTSCRHFQSSIKSFPHLLCCNDSYWSGPTSHQSQGNLCKQLKSFQATSGGMLTFESFLN
jgi:hypothetical protein